ncbi:TMV resistance protein N-like isoform X1 [Lycium barbarum]|uniref:TMV resistance protein N-like isoform X1 n=1 Tax=Lycium barbarum TaxID=112863 RepID=UPI00293E836E|nr:TMV resistance protein N-like isoform X1 [Lycium barbarum]
MLHLNSMIRDDFFFDPFGVFSCHDGPIEFLPNNLRWFVWKYYPSETLPANFEPKRLVHLHLECSLLRQLWTEIKYLTNLKTLDLSFSKRLIQTPNFKGMPSLETLHLKGCINLEEVHQSLGYCKKLIFLNLKECKSLKRLPSSFHAACLKYLDLEECSSLENFPHILGSMCLLVVRE